MVNRVARPEKAIRELSASRQRGLIPPERRQQYSPIKLRLFWNYKPFGHAALLEITRRIGQQITIGASPPNQLRLSLADQQLRRSGIAQELMRASRTRVRA